MYNREIDYKKDNIDPYFDFYKWKPNWLGRLIIRFSSKYFSKYSPDYWKRINKIDKNCKYCFEKSNFSIVKVDIEYKK